MGCSTALKCSSMVSCVTPGRDMMWHMMLSSMPLHTERLTLLSTRRHGRLMKRTLSLQRDKHCVGAPGSAEPPPAYTCAII